MRVGEAREHAADFALLATAASGSSGQQPG
jgi:hypothetical protein